MNAAGHSGLLLGLQMGFGASMGIAHDGLRSPHAAAIYCRSDRSACNLNASVAEVWAPIKLVHFGAFSANMSRDLLLEPDEEHPEGFGQQPCHPPGCRLLLAVPWLKCSSASGWHSRQLLQPAPADSWPSTLP
jgi:hypothetical protein